jgi:hypothetical protein
MGDVLRFRPRGSRPEIMKAVDSLCKSMDREAERRLAIYGEMTPSAALLHVFALYPMFRLTHAKKARSCCFCGRRIEPYELHFVKERSYLCQSGTCMDGR